MESWFICFRRRCWRRIIYLTTLLPSATKLGRLYFYTCLSFCSQGGTGGLPQCMLGYYAPPPDPPGPDTPQDQTPPGPDTPWEQALPPPRAGTPPQSRHPLWSRHPPGPDTPRADGYCCRRYASYWNAFLLNHKFTLFLLSCFTFSDADFKFCAKIQI